MLVYHLIKQPCLVQNNLYSQSPYWSSHYSKSQQCSNFLRSQRNKKLPFVFRFLKNFIFSASSLSLFSAVLSISNPSEIKSFPLTFIFSPCSSKSMPLSSSSFFKDSSFLKFNVNPFPVVSAISTPSF